MAYDSFAVSAGSASKSGGCNRNHVILMFIVAAVGVGVGILIGHFAIDKTSSDQGEWTFNHDFWSK